MKKYEALPSLVNGDIINELLELCNGQFINVLIQPYAGVRRECLFCGAMEQNNGTADHLAADCPVIKYRNIAKKHKRFIVNK